MAEEKGTQKPKERVKYKFGQNDIDLANYIHNLGTNVQSYLNSKNWNEGQKQEFMGAYNRYLTGLQDQLANNTNRFTTDDFGSIIDSTGALSNTDNDDIDPVGSEYYYDNKGNRITTDDFNLLKKRKQKNYSTFSANREVATYFNTIGNALKGMETPKEKAQNAFDLSKHGFYADWITTNNPAGGDFVYNPYWEMDKVNEETGVRDTSNRAAYLKEQIENYIQNIGDQDFSATPFKTRDAYIQRLQEAAEGLANGYNSEDTRALIRAGISGDFLNKFFATGEAPKQKSDLELQAEQAAKEKQEREKNQELQQIIDSNEQEKYNLERNTYLNNWIKENPFTSTINNTIIPSYNYDETVKAIISRHPNVNLEDAEQRRQLMRSLVNFPKLVASYIRGNQKKTGVYGDDEGEDVTRQHIARNLDLAYQEGLFNDSRYLTQDNKSIMGDSGFIVVPDSEDYSRYSFIGYNPVTRQYKEFSMLQNPDLSKEINALLRERMAYNAYDKNIQKKEKGGILKFQIGGQGALKHIEQYKKDREVKEARDKRVQENAVKNDRTIEEQEKYENDSKLQWSDADKLRLGAVAVDITSLIASMTGVGSVASAGMGAASTAANQAADMAEGMGFWESLGNNAGSYVLDAISVLPFAKAAKVPKMVKTIAGFTPKLMAGISAVQGLANGEEILKSLKKVKDGESLTVGDWKNISQGLQIVLGGGAAFNRARVANKRLNAARTDSEYVQTNQGTVKLSADKMKKLRNATSLKQQNEILKDSGVTLKGKQTGMFWNRKTSDEAVDIPENFVYDLSKPVTLHSGDLQYQYKFGLGEKLLGGVNLDIKFPRVRNAYNKVFHPEAYKRGSQSSTSRPTRNQNNFDKLRQLSSQTGELTPQEIAIINRQRVKSGKGKLTKQEIEALNQRRQNRAGDSTDNSFQARLQRYKDAKREGKFTSVEDDIKRAKDELAEATRQQRLAVPTGQGEIVSPDANQARFIMGFSRAVRSINLPEPPRPPISNLPAIIPKQQIRIEQPQQSIFNYDKIREGLARAERERLGRDIGEQRLQRAIEANPERSARLQAQEAYRNVRQAFNLYGVPYYKKPLTGAAYKAKQDMYNRLFNQRRYDMIEAFRNRELPHKQSNKKKKTSRDDRRTVRREDGGTLDLVRVRKFQNAGKFPEWFSKLYKFQNLTGWNNSLNSSLAGPSITNENAGHYKAGDLSEAYAKNNSYTSNPNLVGQDLQSYYDSSFKGKSIDDYVSAYNANAAKIRGFWDQERTYKQSGAQEHNRLFKNMFGNRSGNSNNVWDIGYDSNLEDIIGSSTWLRRMDRYEKEFDNLSDEEKKSRIHKIDLGNGNSGYVYKKANGDIAVWNQPEASTNQTAPTVTSVVRSSQKPSVTSVIQPSQESSDNKQNKSLLSDINPTIAYGLPRAMYDDIMNRRITDLAKRSVVPLLRDPFEIHRYTRSDLDAEMQGERNYADLRRLASRPITSDGSLQTATQLQAEVQGQEARTAGKEKSNQVQRQYDELAWQQQKENAANRHETAMFNREQQLQADKTKNAFEQAYLNKKSTIWDVFGQQLEYDAKVKQKEDKALEDNFAKSDIHNAVSYAPNDYGANLTPEELTVWNKVLSGTNPSSLTSPGEFDTYKLAFQKVSRAENDQLRKYYNVPNTKWSGKTPRTPWTPTMSEAISAKNGAKITIAGIKAKTADAERFQRQIKEYLDRNEKVIDRLSKSLYGLIKASTIK